MTQPTDSIFGVHLAFLRIVLALALLLLAPTVLLAQSTATSSAGQEQMRVADPDGGFKVRSAGYAVLAVVENVGYVPAKLGYALVGAVSGAALWAMSLGNPGEAKKVWRQALGGDYLLTPSMIEGKDPINFSGPAGAPPESSKQSAGSGASEPAAGGAREPVPTPIPKDPSSGHI